MCLLQLNLLRRQFLVSFFATEIFALCAACCLVGMFISAGQHCVMMMLNNLKDFRRSRSLSLFWKTIPKIQIVFEDGSRSVSMLWKRKKTELLVFMYYSYNMDFSFPSLADILKSSVNR